MSTTIRILYHTPLLPPPYAYQYSLQLQQQEQALRVRLDWTYTDRDELTEEEVLDEGFTADDDFFWEGTLPQVWKKALDDLLLATRWASQASDSLRISVTAPSEETTGGTPVDHSGWEYFLQEVIQAVYEAAQRERPLRLVYLSIRGNRRTQLCCEASFLQRRFSVAQTVDRQQRKRQLPWARLRPLLQAWYVPDYHPAKSTPDTPRRPGEYVDPGDGQWYRLGKAVTNPGNSDAIDRLRAAIRSFQQPTVSDTRKS